MAPDLSTVWWAIGTAGLLAGLAFAVAKGNLVAVLKDPTTDNHRVFLASLEEPCNLRRTYTALLAVALDRVDRFLGDADKAALSLPSPFGNRRPAPYWTGWSFDRCALIGVVFPVASIFLVWVVTGEGSLAAMSQSRPHTAPSGLQLPALGWFVASVAVCWVYAKVYENKPRTRSKMLYECIAYPVVVGLGLGMGLIEFSHPLSINYIIFVFIVISSSPRSSEFVTTFLVPLCALSVGYEAIGHGILLLLKLLTISILILSFTNRYIKCEKIGILWCLSWPALTIFCSWTIYNLNHDSYNDSIPPVTTT